MSRATDKLHEQQAKEIKKLKAMLKDQGVEVQNTPSGTFKVSDGITVQEYKFDREKFIVPKFGECKAQELLDSQESDQTQEILEYLITRKCSVIELVDEYEARDDENKKGEKNE